MAINKVDYGDQTLMDLTEDTVTEDKVLEGETFHDRSGNLRTGSLVIPVQDVEVNGESVVNSEKVAEIDIPTADEQTATDEFTTINGGLLSECKVALSPNQDLHGYLEPWVGGASKNKCEMTLAKIKALNTRGTWSGNVYTNLGITYTILTDDADNVIGFDTNGTATARGWMFISDADYGETGVYFNGITASGYTFTSGNPSAVDNIRCIAYNYVTKMSYILIDNGATTNHEKWYPMVRLSSESDPTFEPYSNICPISGHTEVKVGNDGKNCFDISTCIQNKYIDDDGIINNDNAFMYSLPMVVEPNEYYTFSGIYTSTGGANYRLLGYDKNDNFVSLLGKQGASASSPSISISSQIPNNVKFVRVSLSKQSSNCQLEKGNQATAYVPYNGYQVTVNLGGTYYSGTLDVVTGVFTPDSAKLALNTSTIVSISKSGLTDADIFLLFLPSSYKLSEKAILSHYGYENVQNVNEIGKAWLGTSNTQLRIGFSAYGTTTLEDFKTWLDANNVEGCFELANPTPIQLIPTPVKANVGENHLSAPLEGQEITESKYRELFTWDEVEEIAQQIADSKIDDTRTSNETAFSSFLTESRYAKKVYDVPLLTPWYQKSSGATDITFTNSFIFNDSQTSCELIQIGSGPRVGISNVSISAGSVTFTFDSPLAADTRFVCSIINFY